MDHFRAYFSHFRAKIRSIFTILYQIWCLLLVYIGKYPFYINFMYCIVWLFCTFFGNGNGSSPISTNDTVKFINFLSIIYVFDLNRYICRSLIRRNGTMKCFFFVYKIYCLFSNNLSAACHNGLPF